MTGITLAGVVRAAFDGIGRKQTQIERMGAISETEDGHKQFTVYARDGGIYVVTVNTFKEPIR